MNQHFERLWPALAGIVVFLLLTYVDLPVSGDITGPIAGLALFVGIGWTAVRYGAPTPGA